MKARHLIVTLFLATFGAMLIPGVADAANQWTRKHAEMYFGNIKSFMRDFSAQVDGGDLTATAMFRAPSKVEVKKVCWTPHGSNTLAHANGVTFDVVNPTGLGDGGSATLKSILYDNADAGIAPAAEAYGCFGTLSNYYMDEGEILTFAATVAGSTADLPAYTVQVDWVNRDSETATGP